MCESCVAEVIEIGEFLPGFFLVRSSNNLVENFEKGKFGIVIENGPSFVFGKFPKVNPDPNDEDDFGTDEWFDWASDAEAFKEEIEGYGSFAEIHALVSACYTAGYTKDQGSFHLWLFDYLGKFLENKNVTV